MLVLLLGEVIAITIKNMWGILICIPILILTKIITKKQWGLFVMIFLSLIIGYFLTKIEISQSDAIYKMSENNIVLQGRVKHISETNYGWNLYLEEVQICKNKLMTLNNDKLSTNLRNIDGFTALENSEIYKKMLVTLEQKENLEIGNIVKVKGHLKQFEEARNKGNFNSKEYYKSLGIYCKVECDNLTIVNNNKDVLRNYLFNLNSKLCNKLDKICDPKDANTHKAMLLGEKNNLDLELKDLYSLTGISHILSISGLHISFIGMFVYSLLRRYFGFSVSASVSTIFIVMFSIMSGLGIATVRALVMFGLKLLGEVLGREYDYITAISLSGILLLLDNPFVIFNSGFQMSFVAIIAITVVAPCVDNILRIKGVWKTVIQGLTVTICMNPIIAMNYFQLPTYSFILNLIVIPLTSVVLISSIVGAVGAFVSITLGKVCIWPGNTILAIYEVLCKMFSKLPLSNEIVGKPSNSTVFIYYALLILFLIVLSKLRKIIDKRFEQEEKFIPQSGRLVSNKKLTLVRKKKINTKFRINTAIICLLISLLIYNPFRKMISDIVSGKLIGQTNFEVTFLDVGQGDGIFIKTDNGTTVFVDGGSSSIDNVGKYRIIPFLKANKIKKIDYAIVSHTDEDHISGLKEMIIESNTGVKIENIILPNIANIDDNYMKLVGLANKYKINVIYISMGDCLKFGNTNFECLYPVFNQFNEDKNECCIVLNVCIDDFKMLLTGDISMETEEKLVDALYDNYTILKVPHHGSKYSASSKLLEKSNPFCSVISVGKNNMYGHPSEEVLERLKGCKSIIFRTDQNGQISVKYENGEVYVNRFIENE